MEWTLDKKDGFWKTSKPDGFLWRINKTETSQTEKDIEQGKWVAGLSPAVMLSVGVFSGAYFHTKPEAKKGLPKSWFDTPLYTDEPDVKNNFFGIGASQPYEAWRDNGWLPKGYSLGWFHWYCFYFLGQTSDEQEDAKQIGRAKSFTARQGGKAVTSCNGDLSRKPRLRQSLLNWGSSRAFC